MITVNDYLAKRDMEWVGPTHIGLGLKVGAIQSAMQPGIVSRITRAISPTERATNSALTISATT